MHHWHEPKPLGDAQRAGLMQVHNQIDVQQQRQHEAAVRDQIARRHAMMQGRQQPRHLGGSPLGGLGNIGAILGGGIGGVLLGGVIGFYLGRRTEKKKTRTALGLNQGEVGVLEEEEEEEVELPVLDEDDEDDEDDEED